jgi:hypothetical protein
MTRTENIYVLGGTSGNGNVLATVERFNGQWTSTGISLVRQAYDFTTLAFNGEGTQNRHHRYDRGRIIVVIGVETYDCDIRCFVRVGWNDSWLDHSDIHNLGWW